VPPRLDLRPLPGGEGELGPVGPHQDGAVGVASVDEPEPVATALLPDIRNTASAEIREQWLSSDKADRLLGWRPSFTLEQGLAETVAWYRQWFDVWEQA